MRKLITIILVLAASVAFSQTTYQLNYDSVRVGKTAGNGATSLYGKVYLKNVAARAVGDSILTVLNGRIFKVPYSGVNLWQRSGTTLSPLTAGDNILTTGNIAGQKITAKDTLFVDNTNAVIDMDAAENVVINMDRGGNSFKNLITLETSAAKNWEVGTRVGQTGFSIYNNMNSSTALKIDSVSNLVTIDSLKMSDWVEKTVSNHKDFNYSGVQKFRMRNDGLFQSQYGFEAYKNGSNTVAAGAYNSLWNTAGTTGWINQLNASNGLDWWYFSGGSGNIKASLDNNGNFTANNITSGTYTPTLTNTSGIASSTAGTGSYQRIGNQVSGFVDFTATGTSEGVSGVFGVSLPIASNFSSSTNVWGGYGVARSGETIAPLEEVSADTTNDRFIIKATLSDLSARTIRINFSYTIL